MGIICSLPEDMDVDEVSVHSGDSVGPDVVKTEAHGRVDGGDDAVVVVGDDGVVVGGDSTLYGNTRP